MKKLNIISFVASIASLIALVLLRYTGMAAHIAVSVVALLIMVVCAILEKKSWKIPALEIAYRAAYFITLVSGIVMVAAKIGGAVSIVHKAAAAVFAVLFVVNFILSKKK